MSERAAVPRGRHAPPLEIRLTMQRGRLMHAAATVFARSGYADASAEAISREAGMSKATFYEHFANKEECILALFEQSASAVLHQMDAAAEQAGPDHIERMRARIRAFLNSLADFPNESQTLLVEIIGAGPAAAARRDEVLAAFAQSIEGAIDAAARDGVVSRLGSPDEAYAIVGAVAELASRHVRSGRPEEIRALEPLIERLIRGLLAVSEAEGPQTRD
jgi:AcrR family transcriptional regulator